MEVVSFKVDSSTKRRMARIRDINWSEVLRDAIRRRLELEERLRAPIDRRRALEAARRIDAFRNEIGPSEYDNTKEIRRWRDGSRSQHVRSARSSR
jgi:hypothetical protein